MELLKKNIYFLLSENSGAHISSELRIALDHYVKGESTLIDPNLLKHLSDETAWLVDTLLLEEIELRSTVPKDIKMLIFDVDGVMTDAGMYYSESGEESKRFNSRDGLAIRNLNKLGWKTGIISHGINISLIKRRAELLGISHVYAGNLPKTDVLAEWCNELNLSFSQIAFIGDDINDLPIIRVVGFSACPADALNAVKKEVNMVLSSRGGDGAIREWIDRCFLNEHHS
jgi:3-deoxy-D-manno-octulosonate 8-phosphate phosphatase (KDO 8-P phosphatase)